MSRERDNYLKCTPRLDQKTPEKGQKRAARSVVIGLARARVVFLWWAGRSITTDRIGCR